MPIVKVTIIETDEIRTCSILFLIQSANCTHVIPIEIAININPELEKVVKKASITPIPNNIVDNLPKLHFIIVTSRFYYPKRKNVIFFFKYHFNIH